MRMAALFISRPSAGMSESPMPGKSGATTVNRSASSGMIGLHIREVSAYPCKSISGVPWPAVRQCTLTPSISTDRDAIVLSEVSPNAFEESELKRKSGPNTQRPTNKKFNARLIEEFLQTGATRRARVALRVNRFRDSIAVFGQPKIRPARTICLGHSRYADSPMLDEPTGLQFSHCLA